MLVLSSPDLKNWVLEKVWFFGKDVREPRWTTINDSLYLYSFTGSKHMFSFNPEDLLVTSSSGNGVWEEMASTTLKGYVPWRVREKDGLLYMSAYYGKDLYKQHHKGDLRLFISKNGRSWTPLTSHPQIDLPSAEEGEFIFDKNGDLYGTVRLESTGSLILKADRNNPGKWHYKMSKHKYDSALLFENEGDIYLVARRNLMGELDRSKRWLGANVKRMVDLAKYSLSGKVTALFKLNKENLEIEHVMDFPSTGDNAFPALVRVDDQSFVLFNYSSDINGPYKIWLEGQLGKTYIYYTMLSFDK
jgi:hypothetical protein